MSRLRYRCRENGQLKTYYRKVKQMTDVPMAIIGWIMVSFSIIIILWSLVQLILT